jgi:protein involved in ribonucleotide reduction
MNVRLLYISISGNTRNFIERLTAYALDRDQVIFEPVEISDASLPTDETTPFFAFVPTYLDGGNGIDNGVHEILTNALHDQIEDGQNAQHLLGVIGSGNKNFNAQYVLTARRYATAFGVPVIDNFELRGTPRDISRVYNTLLHRLSEAGYPVEQPS